MKCPVCFKPMARDWLYCPYDSAELSKGNGLPDVINKLVNGIKNISRSSGPLNMGGFTIKIKTGPDEKIVASGPLNLDDCVIDLRNLVNKNSQGNLERKPSMNVSGAIEPRSEVKRYGNNLEVVIELPGVNSLRDIDLTHLGESLEVRAASDSKCYFKLLSVPEDYVIINKSVSNGVLLIKMSDKK